MSSGLFRYQGCGLDNVFLRNGYRVALSVTGVESIFIEDVEGLHNAIAKAIIDSPVPLDAKTFKFLRKERDFSQRQLGGFLGVDEQTISLWERARAPIPTYAQVFLRVLTKEACSGNAELLRELEKLNSLDRDGHAIGEAIELEKTDAHWEPLKEAA